MACVITDVAREQTVDLLDGASPGLPAYGAWGTGAGTAAVGDTALFTEASEARVSVTRSQATSTKLRMVFTLIADGIKTITNAGVFSLSSGGILFIHYDHTGVALNAGDRIEYTLDCQLA